MSGGVIIQEQGLSIRVSVAPAGAMGVPVRCPGEHPDRPGQPCNEFLTRIRRVGDETIRCGRCKAYVRIFA